MSNLNVHLQDPNQGLESGEETFFPALRVGLGKISAVVSFYLVLTVPGPACLKSWQLWFFNAVYFLECGSFVTDVGCMGRQYNSSI